LGVTAGIRRKYSFEQLALIAGVDHAADHAASRVERARFRILFHGEDVTRRPRERRVNELRSILGHDRLADALAKAIEADGARLVLEREARW
jgi:hypothetical protein